MGETSSLFWIMTASLTILRLTDALTIDNQLAVIKNDCFERLAIGQRLHPRDIYEMQQLNTVPDCQQVCTKAGDKCKSFSFGISTEGNATCDLSTSLIRETVDLKPIGTVPDTDYDLYIKKLGCKLVIEPSQGSSVSPPGNSIGYNTVEYASPASTSTYKPVYEVNSKPLYHDKPGYGDEEIHQVQTLISIRPSLGLKPLLVDGQESYGSSPAYSQQPQLDFGPRPDDSRPDYSLRPEYFSPDIYNYARPPSSYEEPMRYPPPRPYDERPYHRPFMDERPLGAYESNRPHRPMRPQIEDNNYNSRPIMEDNGYNSSPPVRPINHDNGYNSNSRPIIEDYNSRPPVRPIIEDSGYNSNSPLRPIIDDNGYNSNSRPLIRPTIEDNGYNSNARPPARPIVEDNRYNGDDGRVYRPPPSNYYQPDRLDNPDYTPYLRPQDSGYGSSYGSQYSNYRPSKVTSIISDYDRLPRPIKTKPTDEEYSPYGVPNPYHRYPVFNRPVRPAYDARPYDGDVPPFRPSSLNHPYHENHYFRPGPQEYDPGPIRDRYDSQKPSYDALMTKPPSQDESGYRANSLEQSKAVDKVNQGHGKPVLSYNVGKNGEKITGILTEIDFENCK